MLHAAKHKWARLLAYVTGLVNQNLLLQNEYLTAENRILRTHLPVRMRLSDRERSTLRSASGSEVVRFNRWPVLPNPIRPSRGIAVSLPASSTAPKTGLHPAAAIKPELEALIVRFARENSGWGYHRIVGALANLGHSVSDQTVGNILGRSPNRPERSTGFIHCYIQVFFVFKARPGSAPSEPSGARRLILRLLWCLRSRIRVLRPGIQVSRQH